MTVRRFLFPKTTYFLFDKNWSLNFLYCQYECSYFSKSIFHLSMAMSIWYKTKLVNSCNILIFSGVTVHQNNHSDFLNISNRLFCPSTPREETSVSYCIFNSDKIIILGASISKLVSRYHRYHGDKQYIKKYSITYVSFATVNLLNPYNIVWFTNKRLIRNKIVKLDFVLHWPKFFKWYIKYRMTFSFKSETE